MKKVLVLGAGLVSRPLVTYLLELENTQVHVASRTVSKAAKLIEGYSNGLATAVDVDNEKELDKLVAESDVAISLLPYLHHVRVAKLCLKHRRPLVTTSYVSDAMRALDPEAKKAGIILLNELGLDPGIDHMSAMKIIHDIENNGGRVISFMSHCGGLPAPEANTNPMGYKFSWSPWGVVNAGKNNARFLRDGKEIVIPGAELFANHWTVDVPKMGAFEAYPNRNSMPYVDIYGLKGVRTMLRGTLRNPGWCDTWKKFADLGLLDDNEKPLKGVTYAAFMASLVPGSNAKTIEQDLAKHLKLPADSHIIARMRWLGFFEDAPIGLEKGSAQAVLTQRLSEKMQYAPGERDMIVLHHEFIAEYPGKRELVTSTLVDYGIPNGDSSMSRTVGLPAAIGARMILEGKIKETGVHIPITPDIYEPILAELARQNIEFEEAAAPA